MGCRVSVWLISQMLRHRELSVTIRRLHQALNLPGFKSIINPARAPLGFVQALKSEDGTYPIIPPRFRVHRKNGEPRMACFLMTGTVSQSFILGEGYTSQPNSSGRTRTDKRLSIQPFFGEYQRSLAYIGASLLQPCVAYEFDDACISFITRKKGEHIATTWMMTNVLTRFVDPEQVVAFNMVTASAPTSSKASSRQPLASPLPLKSMMRGPQPFHLGPYEDTRVGAFAANLDFPVALWFEMTSK